MAENKDEVLQTLLETGLGDLCEATYTPNVHAGTEITGAIQREQPSPAFVRNIILNKVREPLWLKRKRHTENNLAEYTVIDGRARVLGARIAAMAAPNCIYVPALWWWDDEITPKQEKTLQIMANALRSDNKITDVTGIMQLRRLGLSETEIEVACGIHPATLKALDKYNNLLPEFEEAWLWFGALDTAVVDQLVRLTEDEQRQALSTYKTLGNKLKATDVKRILDLRPKAAVEVKVNARAAWQDQAEALILQLQGILNANDQAMIALELGKITAMVRNTRK